MGARLPCPQDPQHYLDAHAPGGAWYGVGHGQQPSPWHPPMPTEPTARHLELADATVRGGQMAADAVVERVAELLAREDTRRVPIASVGAAYQRGRGDVIRAVRAEIERPAPVESDVAFGLRLLRLLDNLAGSAGADPLAGRLATLAEHLELEARELHRSADAADSEAVAYANLRHARANEDAVCRIRREIEGGSTGRVDRLDAFRAWLDTDDGRDLVDDAHPVRQALDAFEAADRD